jgi:hypothetical protein
MYDDAERRQRYYQRRRLTRSILIILVIGIGSAIGAFLLGSNLDTTHFHDFSNGFMWRFPSAFALGAIAIGALIRLLSILIKLIRSTDEDE